MSPVSLLWSSDSIYRMPNLWDRVNTALDAKSVCATYEGNVIGGGLFEVADETQAYVDGAWVPCSRGRAFSEFAGFIMEFGRNDSFAAVAPYRKAYDKIISRAITLFPRVVTGNCPPRTDDLLSWNLAADAFVTGGHKAALESVVSKYNTRHVDIFTDFQSLVTAETYTVAELMRDIWHPTLTTGAEVIGDWIAAALQDSTPPTHAAPEVSGRIVNYLFGQPTLGTWSTIPSALSVDTVAGLIPRVARLPDQGISASASGAKLSFPTTKAHQVWAHVFMRKGTGGSVRFYVDRGTGGEVSALASTSYTIEHYPRSILVADGLSSGDHTIEAETTTAEQVTVVGITVVGAD